ncbi:MAG: glycosyltransferase [Steroidobacteraceae bacterium]
MTPTSPAVSVCIPTYRGEAHLAAAIESVLAQGFADLELVVVDDHSPDATQSIVASYKDARIRYLRNDTNLGPQGNWNRALAEARGRYFKLLPHDDLLAKDCLAEQVAILDADREQRVALVFGGREIIDARGRVLMRRAAFGPRQRTLAGQDLIRACVRAGTNLIGEPGNVLLRRELARRIGGFDGTHGYMIDLDYWFRALRHGNATYLPQTLSSFRVSAGSWSVSIGALQQQEFRNFLAKCAADPAFPRLSRLDRWRGTGMAILNSKLRGLLYRRVIEK